MNTTPTMCVLPIFFCPNPTYLLTFLPKEHLKKFIFSFFPVKLWKQLLLLLLTVEHLLMRVHLPTYLPATLSRKPNCLFLQQNFTWKGFKYGNFPLVWLVLCWLFSWCRHTGHNLRWGFRGGGGNREHWYFFFKSGPFPAAFYFFSSFLQHKIIV